MASFTGAKGSICLARGRQYLPTFQRGGVLKTANICNLRITSHIQSGQGNPIGDYLWPSECYCTGVIASTTIELPSFKQMRTPPQISLRTADQPEQRFSLFLASSKAAADSSSSEDVSSQTQRREKVGEQEKHPSPTTDAKDTLSTVSVPQCLPITMPQAALPPRIVPSAEQASSGQCSSVLPDTTEASLPSVAEQTSKSSSEAVPSVDEGGSVLQPQLLSATTGAVEIKPSPASELSNGNNGSTTVPKEVSKTHPDVDAAMDPAHPMITTPSTTQNVTAVPSMSAVDQGKPSVPNERVAGMDFNLPLISVGQFSANSEPTGSAQRSGKSGTAKSGVISVASSSTAETTKFQGFFMNDLGPKQSGNTPTTVESQIAQDAQAINSRIQPSDSLQTTHPGPAQADFTTLVVPAQTHTQNLIAEPTPLPGIVFAGSDTTTVKLSEDAAPMPTVVPSALPIINTARLIQSMGQSEMRVGIRSDEFGNISIRTSTTRDLLSAQISVDNGDLAKALATHLPEMQTRLENNQAGEVRIDVNGQGNQSGTSSGASSQSQDESRSGRRQTAQSIGEDSVGKMGGRQLVSDSAVMLPAIGRRDARLDIRI
jgi:hypothetical protein